MNCFQWIVTAVILMTASSTTLHAQTCNGPNCPSNSHQTYWATPVVNGQVSTSWPTPHVTYSNPQYAAPVIHAPVACPQQVYTSSQPLVNSNQVICSNPVVCSQPINQVQPIVQNQYVTTPANPTVSNQYVSNYSGGLAQRKAQQAASRGIKGHVGGGLGGARFEGVGWSTVSAQSAIQSCCFWGQRPVAEIGVARGSDGWYACVLYR